MPASSGDSVKVAVRVRPFNQREKNAEAKCIISMEGKSTTIKNPETGDSKTFSFDYSYWSHDGFTEDQNGVFLPNEGSNYSDQQSVFRNLGQGVLDNAWQGYNAALFAYGQTGSGKSYSMIGYNTNKGIVPITCGELFKAIDANTEKETQLRVSFSMLEIYNEQVRDLLSKTKQKAGGLKVRQNPKSGFYVEGLKLVPVKNYSAIEKLMEQGTYNRTTASTNMNATSSRSHMVITIKFEQIFINKSGESTTKSSEINLVDLAGSERANSTGATGDRLKEGSAINQSLSTLGNVISALADVAMGKKKVLVPYRDSVLTKLLQSALGGNSRTIMIAALSPADMNYDETLSTLRYADRAKKIQNKAVINESPTERLIRELKEENARLLKMIQGSQGIKSLAEGEDRELAERMLEENKKRMLEMEKTWEQRLEEARMEWEKEFRNSSNRQHDWDHLPYILNVNEDSQLTGVIKHCIHKGQSLIGKPGSFEVTIGIKGFGIQKQHARIENDGKTVIIRPCSVESTISDRLRFGSNSLFLYMGYPKERQDKDSIESYNFDFFMLELTEHECVAAELQTPRGEPTGGMAMDHITHMVFQDYVNLKPAISEANAISEEFQKKVRFELEIKSHASHDTSAKAKEKEIIVRVTNMNTKKVWVWDKDKFLHRKVLMDEIYQRHIEGERITLSHDNDPFWDPVEDIYLASCHVRLQSLSYNLDVDEHFALHNYHGKEEGVVHVRLVPCDRAGRPLGEDHMMEPADLLDKPFDFTLSLLQCMGLRWVMDDMSRGVLLKIRAFGESAPLSTQSIWGKPIASFDFNKHFSLKMTKTLLNFVQNESLVIELWGTQSEKECLHPRRASIHADIELSTKSDLKYVQEEKSKIHKENFKLKNELDMQKEAAAVSRIRRNSNTTDAPILKGHRRSSIVPVDHTPPPGLDVDLAKAIKIFFRDMRNVQNQLKEMRATVTAAQTGSSHNGNLKECLVQQEQKLKSTEENLTTCLASLKLSVSNTIKKSKGSPES
ncbi:kinesin-like protein KIF28P [Gigantopelta aegis]|uniref:kinesin-like protein KIF28P n=1 Tax=Gigantopelta aegis TaxID=1735272 RepID=UPI001B88B48E|nr:kinesin-like protein KIF28P [Gigantopelta aegis]